MSDNILMPERTHDNFGDSIAKLVSIVTQMNNCKSDTINLDFSHSQILNPFFLAGLSCVTNKLLKSGKNIFSNHRQSKISNYLNTVSFPEGFTFGPNADPLNALTYYKYKTYIPIITFQIEHNSEKLKHTDAIISAILNLLKLQLGFSGEQVNPLDYFLSELTTNITEHSKADKGYIFAQYYPNSHYLDLCIADSGIGIFESFASNPDYTPSNEAEALKMALTGKSTKKGLAERGFGISTSRNMLVNGLDGKIFIWTGNTTFLQTNNHEEIQVIEKKSYFSGTFIALRLPTITPKGFDFYKFTS